MEPEPQSAGGGPLPYPLPELPEGTIVVLPQSIDGEVGIYPNATSTLVKELRAEGITAEYLHDADHRQWQIYMGEVPLQLILSITTSVIGSGIWAAFAAGLGERFRSRQVTVHVVKQRKRANGERSTATVDLTGTGPELQKLLETALSDDSDDR
jgi:hypothetical protein